MTHTEGQLLDKQSKMKPNNSDKDNSCSKNKTNQELDYFIARLDMETNREAGKRTT